jgi:DNA polymerase-3 subunit epsilon/CBS domain-containing protein
MLDDAIEAAKTGRELAAAWSTLPAVVTALLGEGIDSRLVTRIVSEELRAMTRRACTISEEALRQSGRGGPPVNYAVLVLGSGGRNESLLAADQDNAVVFDAPGAEGLEGGEIDRWFAEHAVRFTDLLNEAGIPLCRGGVMARNAQWRGSLETWSARIARWVDQSRPSDLLNVDIFFDMTPVHGDIALGQHLFKSAHALAAANSTFAKLLGEAISEIQPLTLLGKLRLENGRIDLKRDGLFSIVALARTLAIRHGLAIRSTVERLEALAGVTGARVALETLERSHETLLSVLLRQQARDIEQGLPPGNRLDPTWLSKPELRSIREALRQASMAPGLVRELMFT